MIKAITFDLWDTIVDDDSDEPKRAAQGLRSKRDERRHILWTALNEVEPIDLATVTLAYDVADASFNIVWKELFINWTVDQRIRAILNGLGRRLPTDLFNRVVKDTGDMEVNIPPNAIEGVKEALADLASRYKLCIVSDAIVTPGTGLRRILEQYDLKQYFSGFAFSDEVGHSKPHRSMFDSAASQLGVQVEEMLHIGDRDHNDIKGPHALGMKAILFTATRDADKGHTTADAIVERYADLPAAIDRLAAASK
ncbi:HAD family hydrolase [Kiloniella laminariae]|uniref:HAD family hydrolase n=1 Tax=Kiloniella laminariae TaxID=454162 RepID=A0ABT4LLQ4_9PROT|nr:HAD family hydrolase [Kiloniella laminariae]MCZ4280902.1 HAD family hydrolase [Kiloniella laminariae]